MAKLYAITPNGTAHTMNLDNLQANSGGYDGPAGWALFPNGMILASYAQSGAYNSPNSQYANWPVNIPVITAIGAFHLTSTGRPIIFSISNISPTGCLLISWDCATNTAPSECPVYAYVLAIGHI